VCYIHSMWAFTSNKEKKIIKKLNLAKGKGVLNQAYMKHKIMRIRNKKKKYYLKNGNIRV
jgi:hypothetical protein